jgi:hypothetical protein
MKRCFRLFLLATLAACTPLPDVGQGDVTGTRSTTSRKLERLSPLALASRPTGPMIVFSCLPSPAPTSTPLPGPSAPGYGCETAVVSGIVYAPDGSPADGAIVTVESLLASSPYTATVKTSQGIWVLNSMPYGVRCQILAGKDHWQTEPLVFAVPCDNQSNFNTKLVLRPPTQWPALMDETASATATDAAHTTPP